MIESLTAREGKKLSNYQPSNEVTEFTRIVKEDVEHGDNILRKSWTELNNRSVLDDRDNGLLMFNAFVDDSVIDPRTEWQWRGTRSKARNKAIQMHAHLTAGYLVPMFSALNEDDEEDVDFSDMMRDVVEWMTQPSVSNYQSSFFAASLGMLVNPVTYMAAEWNEIYQTIKVRKGDGFEKKEILDEILSGFNAPVYSADQVMISNAHEQNLQRHRSVTKVRYIEYGEAKAKYGEHENWQYIMPGRKSVLGNDGAFYDIMDDSHPGLVEEHVYMNRREDTEVAFLGGIYLGAFDIDSNPMRHRDNRNAPKYNLVPFGYQRINEHFFFYKSLMNAMRWDNELIDEQYRIGMNRAFLEANMPVAISGSEKVDEEIIFPSAVTTFEDKDARVVPLLPQSNLGQLFGAMQMTEASMDEASVSALAGGQLPDPNTKATAVNAAQANAQTILEGVGKTLAESCARFGDLMADIAISHVSTAVVDQITGPNVRLKYRTLVLKDKNVSGRTASKVLKFDSGLLGAEMTEEERDSRALELLEKTGYPDNDSHIYLLNPEVFARRKYLTRIDPQRMFPENEEYQKALMSQVYAQFANNPFIEFEELTRRALRPFFRGETEDVMKKADAAALPGALPGAVPGTQMASQAINGATAAAMPGLAQ